MCSGTSAIKDINISVVLNNEPRFPLMSPAVQLANSTLGVKENGK